MRHRFLNDTLDEFWHADAFYFVRHPALQVDDDRVKRNLPSPATLAFELHTLQTAQSDPIGHMLVAYFQESTVHFLDDCRAFYGDVENAYGLTGFFAPWLEHMQLDLDHDHAASVSQLLDSEDMVSPIDQRTALRNAWLAYHYLSHALQEIATDSAEHANLANAPIARNEMHRAEIACECLGVLQQGALAWMARNPSHDAIVQSGAINRAIFSRQGHNESTLCDLRSAWTQALANLLRERGSPVLLAVTARAMHEAGLLDETLKDVVCGSAEQHFEGAPPASRPHDSTDIEYIRVFVANALTEPLIPGDAWAV